MESTCVRIHPIGSSKKIPGHCGFKLNQTKEVFSKNHDILLYLHVEDNFRGIQIFETQEQQRKGYNNQISVESSDKGIPESFSDVESYDSETDVESSPGRGSGSDSDSDDEEMNQDQENYSCLGSVVNSSLSKWAFEDSRDYFILVDQKSYNEFTETITSLVEIFRNLLLFDHRLAILKFDRNDHLENMIVFDRNADLKSIEVSGSLLQLIDQITHIPTRDNSQHQVLILSDGLLGSSKRLVQLQCW